MFLGFSLINIVSRVMMKSLVARETTGLISPLKNFLLPICAAKPDVLNSYLLATVFQCFGEVLAPHLLFAFRANLASGSVSLSISVVLLVC